MPAVRDLKGGAKLGWGKTSTSFGVWETYERLAVEYDARYFGSLGSFYHALETEWLTNRILFHRSRILDIGTGTGRVLELADGQQLFGVGVDLCWTMVRRANGKGLPRASFCVMDGGALAFRPCSFDVVTALGAFEYVVDMEPYLVEINRVLRRGGQLVFSVWNSQDQIRRVVRLRSRIFDGDGGLRALAAGTGNAKHSIHNLRQSLGATGFTVVAWTTTMHILPFGQFGGRWGAAKSQGLVFVNRILRRLFPSFGSVLLVEATKTRDL